ncbi:hypothetical protein KAX17_11100 [Candidatus Bipolaricaulota bacterium]|nr:hypothetical protein [Candidatus Bipolaricaulota bacterium]
MRKSTGLVCVAALLVMYGCVGMLTGHNGALVTAVSTGLAAIALYLSGAAILNTKKAN